jgi:hypothetical protein
MNEYIVGITERELEYFYNKSTGLSNWSELDDMEKRDLEFNTNEYIRKIMFKIASIGADKRPVIGMARWPKQSLGQHLRGWNLPNIKKSVI